MGRHRHNKAFVLCLVVLVGIAVSGQPAAHAPAALLSRALPPAQPAARGGPRQPGGTVHILGSWTGPELDSFWIAARPLTQQSGVTIEFESTPDLPAILASRVTEGAPPDIAVLTSTALAQHYARTGQLVPLRRLLDVDPLYARYPSGWPSLVCVDGEPYGLLYRASDRSLVWYNPGEFQRRHWQVPANWSELVALSERIAGLGLAPWSLGLGGQGAAGEAGTAWLENILLGSAGPQAYDRWLRHEIPWTSQTVRQAFLRWGQIVGRPCYLSGGIEGARAASAAEAVFPLYQDLPGAYLCLAGSPAQALIAQRFPHQAGGKGYDFFPLPPIDNAAEAPVVAGADVIVAFRHTPQVAALLACLASAETQAAWVQRGGFVALGQGPEPASYPDPLSRRVVQHLLEAPNLRFDASAQMPPEVAQAFGRAICDFVAEPSRLDTILSQVEQVAQAAYPQPTPQ